MARRDRKGSASGNGVVGCSSARPAIACDTRVRSEMGPLAGGVALVGVLLIMIILLAVLALVGVKALAASPWGTFTVFCTIPIALLMGVYSRYIRPGRIAEMSAIGFVLLMAALIYGRTVSETPGLAGKNTGTCQRILV